MENFKLWLCFENSCPQYKFSKVSNGYQGWNCKHNFFKKLIFVMWSGGLNMGSQDQLQCLKVVINFLSLMGHHEYTGLPTKNETIDDFKLFKFDYPKFKLSLLPWIEVEVNHGYKETNNYVQSSQKSYPLWVTLCSENLFTSTTCNVNSYQLVLCTQYVLTQRVLSNRIK